jgi:AraC-like DNA-binding protein
VDAFYEPGQFGILLSRVKLAKDLFVRMSFDDDIVHLSFMLEPHLYRIERLGNGQLDQRDQAEPCCFMLRFARGQEILWKSRATNGAKKIDVFMPAVSFERFYNIETSRFPRALRRLATGDSTGAFQSLPITPDIVDCLDQVLAWHQTSPIRGPFVRGKLHNLLVAMWFAAEQLERTTDVRKKTGYRDQMLVTNACLYIRNNLGSDLTIDAIARMVGTNRNKLNQIFQTILGETVFENSQRTRLERARSLLLDDVTRSITAIAQEVGYADSTSFARAFHRRFGMVPSKMVRPS